ncbi:lipocalin Cav p 2.0101-like [Urocitellus parryii]
MKNNGSIAAHANHQYYIKRHQTRSLQSLIYPDLLKDRKTDCIKMKTFLLALGFALISASSQFDPAEITGDWRIILLAANHVEKISEDADMRLHLRHLECIDGCEKLAVTFFIKSNGECQKVSVVATKGPHDVYEAEYAGQNFFRIEYFSNGIIIFYNIHVDGKGKVTHITNVSAKENRLTEEQKKKFEELTVALKIPKENIRNIIETDDCPAA